MPESGYVKKSSVRNLIVMLVLGLFLTMAVGLEVVEYQAKNYAAKKATQVTIKINEAKRVAQEKINDAKSLADKKRVEASIYQTNRTACGIRALTKPGLNAQEAMLVRAKAAAIDKTTSESQRARAKGSVKTIEKQIDTTNKVLELFGTVPPDFNCKTLSKKPPV